MVGAERIRHALLPGVFDKILLAARAGEVAGEPFRNLWLDAHGMEDFTGQKRLTIAERSGCASGWSTASMHTGEIKARAVVNLREGKCLAWKLEHKTQPPGAGGHDRAFCCCLAHKRAEGFNHWIHMNRFPFRASTRWGSWWKRRVRPRSGR